MATARRRGPIRAELEAARDRLLADVLPGPDDPPLRVLFSGINPGLVSAYTGHHFARPGNRFWPALHASGFTPRVFAPAEQDLLPALGLGITNVAPRATARADELTDDELRAGGERLRALAAKLAPAWLAVVGVVAYRTAFGEPTAVVGKQDRTLGATRLWVLPNPSGLNAHYTPASLAAQFAVLRRCACGDHSD
ncbi:G/U mismatch-specific DNA glycosylase [Actinomycetospora sp. NBRC 106378]|uniref:G/U mismatch-specific DNA glycosylase n=1 Tax=Actinomycetospora sp. NBRC 106378 TaxID=3032208 RepID=UPI0024A00263|nr:G/U mismatch-specific DNA glycosylase [Actinomycetospora sp. NBRC 106378]GLZ56120.1 mismatch-specific DNA-glycosylase [Actinomycetospora sp. NBRC 106378]